LNLEKTKSLDFQRGRGTGYVPKPEEIKLWRGVITQSECCQMVYTRQSRWSEYENGKVRMHPAVWELFKIKIRKHDLFREPNCLTESYEKK
jgi:hypothetical protein